MIWSSERAPCFSIKTKYGNVWCQVGIYSEFPAVQMRTVESNEELVPDSAQWMTQHGEEMSSEWQWVFLFIELSPWNEPELKTTVITQTHDRLSEDFLAATFPLPLAAYPFWKDLGKSRTGCTLNKYLSLPQLDVWLFKQAAHSLIRSFVWLSPINEGQSLPAPASRQ